MNKHLYRIVFNHALGIFQVVSELVRRPGRRGSADSGTATAGVRPVSFALWMALGFVTTMPAFAQVAADRNAPGNQRPTVLGSQGNAALINIQTPSAAGVSRNTYSQFDVDTHGAVLNNSRTNIHTQLAGAIAGNPWLATGTAKVILNEVTGSNPSQLNGYIEVAGDRAQVIIASPAGISCDGCGFLNASRVTLTTGTPVLSGGALDSYRVTGGAISVNGKGLDASRADYTDIITRSLQVNAGIWTPQLQVTTGTNQVSADHAQIAPVVSSGSAPSIAVDVSALGGMYANKIQLVGTEHGVGVRNAGDIGAQAGELTVTVDGRLENTGSLQSQSDTQINVSGGIANAGTISAANTLTLTTPQDLDNSNGTLSAGRLDVSAASLRNQSGAITQTGAQAMTLQAGALSNRHGGSIGMPVADLGGSTSGTPSSGDSTPPATDSGTNTGGSTTPSDGTSSGTTPVAPLADGALHIAGLLDNDGGHITANAGFDLATHSGVANDGGQLELRQLTLTGGNLSNNGGALTIDGAATIHANAVANDAGQLTFNGPLSLDVQQLSNRAGTLQQLDTGATSLSVAGTLDNTDGTLASNASSLAISSGTLINQGGTIAHAGPDGLRISTNALYGAGGKIATAGVVLLTAGTVDHQNATLSATQVTLNAASFDNRGGTVAASGTDTNTLTVTGTLDNSDSGTLASNSDLTIQAHVLGNAGGTVQQAGTGALTIQAATLNGAGGTLGSNGTLTIIGSTTDLSGGTTAAQQVAITTDTLSTAHGSLTAASGNPLLLSVHGNYDNTGGAVATNGALQLSAASLDNSGGTLTAAGSAPTQVQVTHTFANTNGTFGALGATTIHAGNLLNQGGIVQTGNGSPLSLAVTGLLDNSADGIVTTDGDLAIHADTLDNTSGNIAHAGQGMLSIDAATLNGHNGSIASNGTLTLTGTTTNLSGGTTQAQTVSIDTGSLSTAGGTLQSLGGDPLQLTVRGALDNTQGSIATNGALQLSALSLRNTGGNLTAAGTAASQLRVVDTLDNSGGTLATMGATGVHAGSLINQGGTVQAAGGSSLTLTVDGLLDNSTKGLLTADGDLAIKAATLDNTQGMIEHAGLGTLAVTAATLDGAGGTLASNGTLTLAGNSTDLSEGTTYAQKVMIDTGALRTAGGSLVALGSDPLQLTVRGLLDNSRGSIETNGALQLSASSLDNTGGTLTAAGNAPTEVQVTNTFTNTDGTLGALGATTLQAGNLLNQGGTVQTGNGSPLTLTVTGLLDNSANGIVTTDGDLAIHAATLDNTSGNIVHAGQGALTIDAATLNGRGGTIASNGTLTLTGTTTDLSAGTTQAQTVSINTGALSTAGGHLNALGGDPLQLTVRSAFDNTGGSVIGNGALALGAGSLANTNGTLIAAGAGPTQVQVTGTFDNTRGTFASAGATTLHTVNLINAGGTVQAADTSPLTLTVDGLLDNDQGAVQTNGDLVLTAGSVSNYGGAVQTPGAIHAIIGNTLDNTGGALVAGGNLTVQAGTLLNGNTLSTDASAPTTGLFGQQVSLNTTTLDNTQGLVVARDALNVFGATLSNAGGVLDGQGTVTITGTTLDNTGGQLIQHGDTGSLAIHVTQALDNTNGGVIGAEGSAQLHAGTFDNSGGTVVAQHDLALTSDSNLLNGHGGVLQTKGALTLNANGTFDNSGGQVDATGAATVTAAAVSNVGGQLVAGDTNTPEAALQITSANAINNRGGTIGNRGGDVTVQAASIDNSAGGTLVAQRDFTLDTNALNNGGGTAYATRNLSFQNINGTLDNTNGQFGAGDTAWLNLAQITNNSGHLQANTLWLITPTLNNDGGEVVGTTVHATFASLNGIGRLYGAQLLDAHVTGDYTHLAGQRLESDSVLSLTVDGTLTNQGTLQTPGELDITAANVINTNGGVINASATDGSAVANITASGSIDNQHGATLEGDTLALAANTLTNTGDIIGDAIRIDAASLTNGRDLGTGTAAVDYGEDFIGAAQTMDLHVGTLANLDGQLYSGGNLTIAADAAGNQAQSVINRSGLIQAQGDLNIAAQQITNQRRMFETGTVALSAADQAANSLTTTAPQYVYNDPLAAHQVPNIDPSQVVDAAELAKANAYCNANSGSSNRCIFFQTGPDSGDPSNYQMATTTTVVSYDTLTAASAAGQLVSGGDMSLTGAVLNDKSAIAAGGNLTIVDPNTGASGAGAVQNIAWAPTAQLQTTADHQVQSQYLVTSPSRTWLDGDWWSYDTQTSTSSLVLAPGQVPSWITLNAGPGLAGTITAGGAVTIVAGNVTNTVVGGGGGVSGITTGGLAGPGSTSLANAQGAQATTTGGVNGAAQSSVDAPSLNTGTQTPSTVNGGQAVSEATSAAVSGPGRQSGAAAQTVGNADHPLPGYTPPNNAMVQQHTDPGAPFLITTAPRFAKGPVTSSDYLLQALGDDPANMQKRLGDGYYEQNLVMDQILQLTGRRSLNGDGDAMAQYTDLMAHAAAQAAQLGLSLGAPLTSSQIAALSSDIVWLVDTVVDGLTGPERRRRWSVDEKLALVRESFEAGKTVSMVARQHGLNPNQLFYWRKLYQDGSLSAVAAGEEVVAASQLANALRQIKELQRMLGKKTMEVEILREAIAVDRPKKWIARSPLSLEDTP